MTLFPATVFSWLAFLFSLIVCTLYVFMGEPPRHCRYMVPIVGHPHVYGCSEYPYQRYP